MFRIAYRSRLAKTVDDSDVRALIDEAVKRNGALGITGTLMVCDGECLSSIEGPPLAVKQVAESIWDDPRHSHFRLMAMDHTDERMFDGWAMTVFWPADIKDQPELREHKGLQWLSDFAGGIDGFYGDALRYHH